MFKIQNRIIGPDHPPLIIAEVGINHEGSFDKAIECVDSALKCGAEVVKFQCHITEKEMIKTDMTPGDISQDTLWSIIKRCELTEEEEFKVKKYCDQKDIIYLSTPFSREAADRLDRMGIPAFKIGSGECNNLPLIDHIASKEKPIILSTGMNDLNSIRKSVAILRKRKVPFALLHCTSMYPTPYDKVRLGGIEDLAQTFPDALIGLSDHSLGIYTCLGAVALGACILEKHFAVSRDWPGPDVAISIEPYELKDLVKGSKAVWEARGGRKTILKEEKPVIDFAYATVVAIKPLKKGDILTKDNIWVKRPGTGEIHAENFENILGKQMVLDIPCDTQLKYEHFR
ncbi:MAG: polyhydroxyalkanoate biosynthesis repressor PhaR [Alphaproteobacteria bacterium]|nr:polyhydroxyalkanoate biosynthesis repressor PhaR [Candidatus Parcubacteria bacterium]NCQ67534.1 polyhydroxyalkanoate biosynthesis repressor PhaR [Alphaproteobacteria bacterium]